MNDVGLVLGGGASRGAYQVGVLRYVFCDLAKRLGKPTWPSMVSGTSVGAVNGVFAAAQSEIAIERLSDIWQNLTIDQIYQFRWTHLVRAVRDAFRTENAFSLLDPTPFYDLSTRRFPHGFLRRAIDSGSCRALILSATAVDTGYNVLFIDTADPDFRFVPSPGAVGLRVATGPRHVHASGALPVLFPPVEIGEARYVDGGLRQNTPLRPLLRAGVSKALVVGVKQGKVEEGAAMTGPPTPNLPFLLGKTFNALMLDPVERDIEHADRLNQLILWGTDRFGTEFADDLETEMGFRHVDICFLKPREDLGRVAAETFRTHPPDTNPQVRYLLSFIADRANRGEADLLSYLYFDKAYTGLLERLGWEDARDREEELAALFGGDDRTAG